VHTRRGLVAFVPLIAALVIGCGSDSSNTLTPVGASPADVLKEQVKPVGPPPNEESIFEAKERLTAAIASGDCERIDSLAPLAVPDSREYCESVKQLAQYEFSAIAEYGDLAGVMDFSAEGRVLSAILIRDSDGLFHLAFVAGSASPTVGTPFAHQFVATADSAVKDLRERDCDAFRRVASPQGGIGSISATQACLSGEAIDIGEATFGSHRVRPRLLGGNSQYAFFGLNSPQIYVTIVEARNPESETDGSTGGASEYVYVASYLTNRREAPLQSPVEIGTGPASPVAPQVGASEVRPK
jgi:hypothetical protein